jgi:hypothetical protein
MDLDSRGYSKLIDAWNSVEDFAEHRRIVERLGPLTKRHDHETPEMWCSRIRDPFRKILEDNPRILSKNGYITMYGNLYESNKVHSLPTNYIYCSVCDSLVFIPENGYRANSYRDNHLKSCINEDTISKEYTRRKEILQSIDRREFKIWQYKQYILQEETKINRLRLELFSQSTSHSEKDKLASVSYNHDGNFTASYENYAQSKANIAKNTMPSALERYPMQCNASAPEIRNLRNNRSNCKSNTSEIFISSQYAKQNNLLPSINNLNQPALRLKDGTKITFV